MCRRVVMLLFFSVVFLGGRYANPAAAQKTEPSKGKLPTYWTTLGLSADQKEKMYKIRSEYEVKLEKLKAQLKEMEKEEKQKLYNVLTAGQKKQLNKIYLEKFGIDPFAPPKKAVDPKKEMDQGTNPK